MNDEYSELIEKDYLQVIDIINGMQECESKNDLELFIKEVFFPTFSVQQLSFMWVDDDLKNKSHNPPKNLIQFGCSQEEIEIAHKLMPYLKTLPQKAISSLRPVLAHDVDIPQETLENELALFFQENPQYKREDLGDAFNSRRSIAIHNPPEFNMTIGLVRHHPNNSPFTFREIRMVELLRFTFFRVIKFIAINEEIKNFRSLSEVLAESPTAMAMVNPNGYLVFANETFQKVLNIRQQQFLPKDLAELLLGKTDIVSPGKNIENILEELTFYSVDDTVYRLSWTRLKRPGEPEDGCWLLRMKPAIDPYSQTLLAMRKAKLTRRETEIATLVCDGIADPEISSRLFISEYTVKNHVSNIFQKLNIHKRIQLVAQRNNKETQHGN